MYRRMIAKSPPPFCRARASFLIWATLGAFAYIALKGITSCGRKDWESSSAALQHLQVPSMATTNPLIKDVKDIIACQRFLETNGTESNGVWSWYDFIDSDNVDSPTAGQPTQKDDKILVAQTSGYNAYYRDMMSITSHVNRAYSRHWGYDFVTFEGILLGCLGSHSSFNKIGIIQEAIERQYDALLLLDADQQWGHGSQLETSKDAIIAE